MTGREKVDRLPILVSGDGMQGILSVPSLSDGNAGAIAEVTRAVITEWDQEFTNNGRTKREDQPQAMFQVVEVGEGTQKPPTSVIFCSVWGQQKNHAFSVSNTTVCNTALVLQHLVWCVNEQCSFEYICNEVKCFISEKGKHCQS